MVLNPEVDKAGASHVRPAARRGGLERKRKIWGILFILPAVLYIAFVTVGPLFFNFWLSLTQWNPLAPLSAAKFVGIANYRYLFTTDTQFPRSLINSFIFAAARLVLSVGIGLGLALLLNNKRLAGLRAYRVALYLPAAASAVVMSRIWQAMYNKNNGMVNQVIGLLGIKPIGWLTNPDYALLGIIIMSVYASIGYNAIVFLAGLQGIPEDVMDAAHVDGADGWRRLWHITLPLLRPVVAFVSVISIITGLQVFDLVWATTQGGPANATQSVVLLMYKNVFVNNRAGMGAAMAFVLFAIIVVLSIIQLRLLRQRD